MSSKVCQRRVGVKSMVCVNIPWDCRDNTPSVELFSLSPSDSNNGLVKKILSLMDKKMELQKN